MTAQNTTRKRIYFTVVLAGKAEGQNGPWPKLYVTHPRIVTMESPLHSQSQHTGAHAFYKKLARGLLVHYEFKLQITFVLPRKRTAIILIQ